jgi:hypothetical protein
MSGVGDQTAGGGGIVRGRPSAGLYPMTSGDVLAGGKSVVGGPPEEEFLQIDGKADRLPDAKVREGIVRTRRDVDAEIRNGEARTGDQGQTRVAVVFLPPAARSLEQDDRPLPLDEGPPRFRFGHGAKDHRGHRRPPAPVAVEASEVDAVARAPAHESIRARPDGMEEERGVSLGLEEFPREDVDESQPREEWRRLLGFDLDDAGLARFRRVAPHRRRTGRARIPGARERGES